ncbi:MAG: pyruvate carboxylase, partial [Mailhella sp.]|nr:pyruvate carboxylase [Mailhella sp.]
ILENEQFRSAQFDTGFVAQTPELFDYQDLAPEGERLSRLVAEITAKGYNPYVQLGQYRVPDAPRMPEFAPVLPHISGADRYAPNPYPRQRGEMLEFLRDSKAVHFTDTTTRDMTQSNTGNRFRLAEDMLLGPYLDSCNFFSLENGGGAHFHVAMLANMTYPFTEAREWNRFAPKTLKQLLVRSTNVLGYTPQPRNLMNVTGEMICDNYHIVRCFDFLNDMRNMRPLAEVVLSREDVIFEPALSISVARGFDIDHYLGVTEATLEMVRHISGCTQKDAARMIILGLKDMAGICSPTFIAQLVAAIRKKWPDLVMHYHRHATDGLFIPAVGAAAKAGAQIVDTGLGACVRTYGQGDVLATVAYMENELGLKTLVNKEMIAQANFVLKQIMPYYDRYCSPYFQGTDYGAVSHCMPGGATSSSQEGAMKQGYIKLLPDMLRFLAAIRQIVRYHDVTPGSQITWNTAFLAVTNAYKRQGEKGVQQLLKIAETAAVTPEDQLTDELKRQRLEIYRDCNDAFRNLLLGKFGRLPLGFPEDWVYESAFGSTGWRSALAGRTEDSPLDHLKDVNIDVEAHACADILKRTPSDEELVMYLNHPGDAVKTIQFVKKYGDPNRLPLDVWFEGLKQGRELQFTDSNGKPHQMTIFRISPVTDHGTVNVRYTFDSQILYQEVKVAEGHAAQADLAMADPSNKYHVPAPSNGDLWVVYVKPGDIVKAGDELFNISIMKQEKAVLAPVDGIVKRVLKTADYQLTRKMTPVREGELIIELAPCPTVCQNAECGKPLPSSAINYCPWCGAKVEKQA